MKTKREQIIELESFLDGEVWQEILKPEIERIIVRSEQVACNLKTPQAERDGAAGAREELKKVIDYPTQYVRALRAQKEKKATLPK